MSIPRTLPRHLRPRREKVFGDGRPRPLDRNAKARIMHTARALMHRTEKGKHYGKLTAKYVAVLEALLWSFHNARSGLCFPSYETIAERAKCTASTVGEAIKALEDCGLLSWVNRIVRIRERSADLFGHLVNRWRVIRTSNGYQFHDPKGAQSKGFASNTEFPSGTSIQDSISSLDPPAPPILAPDTDLGAALLRFQAVLEAGAARR